mgnify:CR=1 FL=1
MRDPSARMERKTIDVEIEGLRISMCSILTSIKYHIGPNVAGCQRREKVDNSASKAIIVSTVLLVQGGVEVEVVVQTGAINNQVAVLKLHVFEEVSVPLHKGGQTLDSHWILRAWGKHVMVRC